MKALIYIIVDDFDLVYRLKGDKEPNADDNGALQVAVEGVPEVNWAQFTFGASCFAVYMNSQDDNVRQVLAVLKLHGFEVEDFPHKPAESTGLEDLVYETIQAIRLNLDTAGRPQQLQAWLAARRVLSRYEPALYNIKGWFEETLDTFGLDLGLQHMMTHSLADLIGETAVRQMEPGEYERLSSTRTGMTPAAAALANAE